jgi:hypothetical protein
MWVYGVWAIYLSFVRKGVFGRVMVKVMTIIEKVVLDG